MSTQHVNAVMRGIAVPSVCPRAHPAQKDRVGTLGYPTSGRRLEFALAYGRSRIGEGEEPSADYARAWEGRRAQ